ncbi:class I SAM-dependent methyltransferase [Marivirga harenae]|uniref:O-methyltransferase n=1 Tax=Marivirga harenae TaxID=2010992 RepID=UPI0026DF1619|nr:class I SAM-dependent methyltransferase [Marivirga harenae]WKV11666.1 class I SAM-dependent methyltransferase [Marivirga harenae]
MNLFLVKEYIRYFHFKTDEHSLHSLYFYNFYTNLIKRKKHSNDWEPIEKLRSELLKDNSEYKILDLGAGSKVEKSTVRKVKSIAKHSLSSPKFSQLLFQLIRKYKFRNIIELGTSLGINTAYISKADEDAEIHTFEADHNAMAIAKKVNSAQKNIKFHNGDITEILPAFLQQSKKDVDLVYADANHTYEASIHYFNVLLPYLAPNSIYIMDDIHWSAGMKRAWLEIRQRNEVKSSIDLFDAGILFFNPDFKKQNYVLDF